MINRVTHQTAQRNTLANLQVNLARMSDMQAKMSSGKVITKPSDAPGATGHAMQLRSERRAADQMARNATDGASWMTTVDSTLSTSTAALRKARDLTVQGASSGSLNAMSREAIATQIEGIRDEMLGLGNTQYLGRSVFAGTSDAGVAFDPTTYAWTGVAGGTVERRLAPDTSVRVDADGSAAFGSGDTSVFKLLDSIAADLRAGVEVQPRLGELDTRLDAMLSVHADVGVRHSRVITAQSTLEKASMDLRAELSSIEDIDLAEAIMELQMQEVAYKGALGATSRVLQPSLMDFLR